MSITLVLGVLPKDYNFEIKSAYELALKMLLKKTLFLKVKQKSILHLNMIVQFLSGIIWLMEKYLQK